MQRTRLRRSNLAVAVRLIDSPVLDFEACIHLGPAGMVLCPPGRSHLAGAGDNAERRDDNGKAGLLEIVNIGFLLCVSGVLIHPTRETMPMRRLSVVKRSIHEPDMSMA